ncbi:hypothetical protein CROQUDRAFT_359733 [Cronartium quercuum f. sp. fusiforme G11]|uniref:Uncharacterized protein n=1 Tax=Cronartium quercuum f. sp. fusiforme G11 TaxID=708437 RepID=A0A9P6TE05_9BASI|nr:hypothetical protein CROQUDRAFT_359733 [Cronartium quercuum f. sp. fusiforme G11]
MRIKVDQGLAPPCRFLYPRSSAAHSFHYSYTRSKSVHQTLFSFRLPFFVFVFFYVQCRRMVCVQLINTNQGETLSVRWKN